VAAAPGVAARKNHTSAAKAAQMATPSHVAEVLADAIIMTNAMTVAVETSPSSR